MSFRTEEKLVFHKSDHQNLLKFIHNENAKKIFFKRQIKSIYFDNKLRQSYFNSEEGVVPRKTIRIRSYDEFETNSLEVKINSVEGKFKQSINLDKKKYYNLIQHGYFDSTYGLMYPVCLISYKRSYFKINPDVRLTLDNDMEYSSYVNKSIFYKDIENLILEVKLNYKNPIKSLSNIIPFERIRMSKYCTAINKLYNNNFEQKLRVTI